MKANQDIMEAIPLSHCAFSSSPDPAPASSNPPQCGALLSRRLSCGLLLLWFAHHLLAEERLFPADAGFVNVKNSPYSAKGDGVTDDTAAIRAALKFAVDRSAVQAQKPIVFFPSGIYLVSKPLESRFRTNGYSYGWCNDMTLLGQNEKDTIIRLQDHAPGYDNVALPLPVIRTGSETNVGIPNYDGSGGSAHRHSIINLTIDTGSGNPGAVGIDYLANNQGVIKDVTIRSGDGTGLCGLSMTRYAPGPALVKRLRIEGFDTGIALRQLECSMTIEHLTLVGQQRLGIDVIDNVLSIRELTSSNAVPVMCSQGHALVTLLDGAFTGGVATNTAITNSAKLYLRNLTSTGYGTIIANQLGRGVDVPGGEAPIYLPEYVSQPALRVFASPAQGLHLPVEETPEFHTNDFSQWASVVTFGATPNNPANDDAPAIQAAIDSGKPVVYFPRGEYAVRRPLILRGAVRKFTGLHSFLGPAASFSGGPLLRFEGGSAEACIVEHFRLNGGVEHASAHTLVLCHSELLTGGYRNTISGTGRMFLEDVVARPILVNFPQQLWARQLNPENGSVPLVENHGGAVWILGLKTEGPVTVVKNVQGCTEVAGGLTYPTREVPAGLPLFINEEGSLSFTHLVTQQNWPLWVRETRDGLTRNLPNSFACFRGVPLFAGYLNTMRLSELQRDPLGLSSFVVQARPWLRYAIEASDDLLAWVPIHTNVATATPYTFTDTHNPNAPIRFYRTRQIEP